MNKRYTLEAAEKLRGSDLPILLAWAPEDRVFPLKFAERLAAEAPNARIVEIPDAGTFVPLDQPERVADEIAELHRDRLKRGARRLPRKKSRFGTFSRSVHVFRLTGGPCFTC